MKIKYRSIFLIVFLVIAGCVGFPLQSPSEEHLLGEWESTGMYSYAHLKYYENGTGLLAFAEADEAFIYELSGFKASSESFSILLTDVTGEEEPQLLFGSFWGEQLNLREEEKEEPDTELSLWFTKSSTFNTARETAKDAIEKFRNNGAK